MNGTILVQDTPMFSTIFVTVCFVIYMLIIATSLLGNTMVCLVICLNRSLRSCPTMSFILSLACSDLLTAAFAMPFDAEALLHEGRWRHAEVLCIVWTTAYLLSVPASITTLLFLTIDRYKSLSDPLRRFRESKFLSLRWARVTVVAVWCYCLAFALLPVMGWRYNPSYLMGGSCIFNITPFYSALSTALHFILPLLIIAAVYIKIYRIAQNVQNCHALCNAASNNQLPEHVARHPTARDHRTYQRKLSSSRTIALIVFALFICWFPYSMTSFVFSLCEPCYHAVSQNLLGAFLILGYLNSALNPFIYSIRNKRFKESYRAMFLSTIRFVRGISFNRSAQSSHNSSISSQRHVSVMSLETSSVQLTSFSIPSGSRVKPKNRPKAGTEILRKFYQAPVTRLISNSTAHEVKPREDEQNPRRDESPTTTLSPTFKVSTKNFPVNPYMANVVFQLFGKDGILEKGGFSRSGYILRSAAASVVLVKTFGDRRLLLDKVLKAKQAPIRDGGLAVVIQLFFSNSDYINFVGWLRQEIRSGYVNYDDPCSPVVVIRFICCTPNGSPLLAPEFGTLRVDID